MDMMILGGLLVILVFFAGVAAGFVLGEVPNTPEEGPETPPEDPETAKRQQENLEAFESLMNYNADEAYQLNPRGR